MIVIDRAQQIEAMALVKICPAIFALQRVLICGKPRDASSVVIRVAEGVLRQAREPAARIAAERKVERVADLPALRLDLANDP